MGQEEAAGQNAGDAAEAAGRGQDERTADISFASSLRASDLCFLHEPQARVTFHGTPGHRSTSRSVRRNLPERVRARVAYQDVDIAYTLATKFTGGPHDSTERRTLGDPAPDSDDAARDADGSADREPTDSAREQHTNGT
ncbi:hypothetical protein AB0B12_27740 [Streptomyces sp. NPDC044780]|uniref:hypothetical protein n=1 Tax=unclassified Streptomyces TaxID=2593676 RepID=UPI00340D8B7D